MLTRSGLGGQAFLQCFLHLFFFIQWFAAQGFGYFLHYNCMHRNGKDKIAFGLQHMAGIGQRADPFYFFWMCKFSYGKKPAGIAPRVKRRRIYLVPPLHAYPRTTIAWVLLAFFVPPSVKRV